MSAKPSDPAGSPAGDHQCIFLEDVAVTLSLGIADWERLRPQKVLISVAIDAAADGPWATIEDCLDYDRVHTYLTRTLPARGHIDLVENLADDIARFVLEEPRAQSVRVRIAKVEVYSDTAAAGITLHRSRA